MSIEEPPVIVEPWKACRGCDQRFDPQETDGGCCSPECKMTYLTQLREKLRARTRAKITTTARSVTPLLQLFVSCPGVFQEFRDHVRKTRDYASVYFFGQGGWTHLSVTDTQHPGMTPVTPPLRKLIADSTADKPPNFVIGLCPHGQGHYLTRFDPNSMTRLVAELVRHGMKNKKR